jgi:transcriptional regulator of acetoin/glycerol metabolism
VALLCAARCDGNLSAAAREAGIDRKTFYALLTRGNRSQNGLE